MSESQEHPVRRLAEEWLRSYKEWVEQCRRYQTCVEEAQDFPSPSQAKAAAILRRYHEDLVQWAAILHDEFAVLHPMLEEVWQQQLRVLVDGLDEELSQLTRESD
jgi:hypothetical protein